MPLGHDTTIAAILIGSSNKKKQNKNNNGPGDFRLLSIQGYKYGDRDFVSCNGRITHYFGTWMIRSF